MSKLETLGQSLQAQFGERLKSLKLALGEATIEVDAADYLQVMQELRDSEALCFDELIDLCGVDYSTYGNDGWSGKRYAVVVHLLSVAKNWRLRVRVFAPDDAFPRWIPSSMSGVPPTGLSAKLSTCSASFSRVTKICAAS